MTSAPRIAPLDPAAAAPEAAAILEQVRAAFGMLPNVHRVLAHSPAALAGYGALALSLEGGSLSARIKEQIALLAAATNGCDYCLAAHRVTGRLVGLTAPEIAAAETGEANEALEHAALIFAAAVLRETGGISAEAFDAAQSAGLSNEAMIEITAQLVANIFTNTVNRLARTPIDFGRPSRA
jgi:uncharacterized peroxidase-related enzyme